MYQDPFTISTFVTVVLAALTSTIIGIIWYHPVLFGRTWMRLSNLKPELVERAKRRAPVHAAFGFLASMVAAYVIYTFGAAANIQDWEGATTLSFWCWFGFTVPTLLGAVIWEQRPVRLYLIDVMYWFVAIMAMSCILLF